MCPLMKLNGPRQLLTISSIRGSSISLDNRQSMTRAINHVALGTYQITETEHHGSGVLLWPRSEQIKLHPENPSRRSMSVDLIFYKRKDVTIKAATKIISRTHKTARLISQCNNSLRNILRAMSPCRIAAKHNFL